MVLKSLLVGLGSVSWLALAAVPARAELRPVYVESRAPAETAAAARARGAEVNTVAGSVLTLRIAEQSMPLLESLPGVTAVNPGRAVRPRLDLVIPELGVDAIHAGEDPLPRARTGRGVIIGFVDFGLNLEHAAFQDAQGESRVLSVWDTTATGGDPPEGRSYGHLCSREEIAAGSCELAENDNDTHGTHVAGIAAGRPVGAYGGIAPDADLLFVNLSTEIDRASFDTEVCDGVAWLFETASDLGRPIVVNLSLGNQLDPHDGSSLANQCLDELSGPGRIMVSSAGNEGQPVFRGGVPASLHAAGTAVSDTPAEIAFVPIRDPDGIEKRYGLAASGGPRVASGAIYFDGDTDLRVELGIEQDGEIRWTGKQGGVGDEPHAASIEGSPPLGPLEVECGEMRPGGTRFCEIRVVDENGDRVELNREGRVRIHGNGDFDGYMPTDRDAGFTTAIAGAEGDDKKSIGYPAVSAKVLAVGSYVTRTSWESAEGEDFQLQDPVTGEALTAGNLSSFSSRGPSRNVQKTGLLPDIVAPGEVVISALQGANGDADFVVEPGPDGFAIFGGTSMSSPAAAGVIALMLEARPDLEVDDIRDVFAQTARDPGTGEKVPNTNWGHGKLDALAALAAIDEGAVHEYGDAGAGGRPSTPGKPPGGAAGEAADESSDGGGCSQKPAKPSGGVWFLSGLALLAAAQRFTQRKPTR